MKNGSEYFKLITDMLDVQQQVGYLLQRTMSVGDDIEALHKEIDEQKEKSISSPTRT